MVECYHKTMNAPFSNKIKELRIEHRLTLRQFCEELGLDPSNWSKVERGINPPPNDVGLLEKLASFFGLDPDARLGLMDSAALQRGELPKDIAEDEVLKNALPAFFRAARGHQLSEEERKDLFQEVLKLNSPD